MDNGSSRAPRINERLKDVLSEPCEKLEVDDEREQEKGQEIEKDCDIAPGPTLVSEGRYRTYAKIRLEVG